MAEKRVFAYRGFFGYLFPSYRLKEEVPFGFWYVGFFALLVAFFNLSINFFSHFSLLLSHLTGTLEGLYGVTASGVQGEVLSNPDITIMGGLSGESGIIGTAHYTRSPNNFDFALSGIFALYYLVSVPLFVWLGAGYWNFKEGAKKRLTILIIVDIGVFLLYNLLFFIGQGETTNVGVYFYANHYLKFKAPLYVIFAVTALFFLFDKSDEVAKKVV